jgi:hypothetical protein
MASDIHKAVGRVVPVRERRYRDYRINMMHRDRGWQIEAVPLAPGKTILQLFSSSEDVVSEEEQPV